MKQTFDELVKKYKRLYDNPFADGYTFKAFEAEIKESGFTFEQIRKEAGKPKTTTEWVK